MANLVKYADDLVDVVDDDDSIISLVLSYGALNLVYSENGVFVLGQQFDCDVSDLLDKKQVFAYFPDRLAIRTKAHNYTKGITNKVRFKASLDKLLSKGRVEEAAYLELNELIKDAHCPPVKLLERIFRMGHMTIAKDLDFYDEDPLLERSINLLIKFMELL